MTTAITIPQQTLDAEEAALGACMHSSGPLSRILATGIRSVDFSRGRNRVVFEAIQALDARGELVDEQQTIRRLRESGTLDAAGGEVAVTSLAERVPAIALAATYAQHVIDAARLRALAEVGNEIAVLGAQASTGQLPDGCDTVQSVIDRAHAMAAAIGSVADRSGNGFREIESTFGPIYDDLTERAKHGRAAGVPTGFPELDRVAGGLEPEQLWIVAARPAIGKSAFAGNLAYNVASSTGDAVAIFSMEMSTEQIGLRYVSMLSDVPGRRIQHGAPHEADWQRITEGMQRLRDNAPGRLLVDESTTSTPSQIASRCRRLASDLARKHRKLGMIIVDYMQLMEGDTRSDNRAVELGQVSASLKRLAKELRLPIVALAQLNRNVEARADKRPMLSDLKDSGSLEQDANKVLMLHRPEYYLGDNTPPNLVGMCEVIVAKNREGATGSAMLKFDGRFSRFESAGRNVA